MGLLPAIFLGTEWSRYQKSSGDKKGKVPPHHYRQMWHKFPTLQRFELGTQFCSKEWSFLLVTTGYQLQRRQNHINWQPLLPPGKDCGGSNHFAAEETGLYIKRQRITHGLTGWNWNRSTSIRITALTSPQIFLNCIVLRCGLRLYCEIFVPTHWIWIWWSFSFQKIQDMREQFPRVWKWQV